MIWDWLSQVAWYFYALGPQLVCCLALGWWAARRTHGNLVNWLTVAFLASIIPLVGVIVMAVLLHRATVRAARTSLS